MTNMDFNLLPTWRLKDAEWSSNILLHVRLLQLQPPTTFLLTLMRENVPLAQHLQCLYTPLLYQLINNLCFVIAETQALTLMILDIHPGLWTLVLSPCQRTISVGQ